MIRSIYNRSSSLLGRRYLSTKLEVPLAAEYYVDRKYYDAERKELLGPSWQLLTHESVLAQGSDTAGATYFADTVSDWPCILVRNTKTKRISGFHNICRHRAGPLEFNGTQGACKVNGLTCKYHGWNYTLDGALRGTPRFGDISSVKKSDFNLWPLRVANWRGLLFVQTLPPEPSHENMNTDEKYYDGPLADAAFIADNPELVERLADVPLEDMQTYTRSETHSIKCNWKVL